MVSGLLVAGAIGDEPFASPVCLRLGPNRPADGAQRWRAAL